MRKIYKYDEQAKKYLSAIIKRKMPKSEPWLHVGVKTLSNRSPWSAIVIWVWDTRQVIFEHRFQGGGPTNEQMLVQNSHMRLANDNRQPLVGGRNDINELMELGPDFDASHGKVFEGKNRIAGGNIWKKKTKLGKPSNESAPGTNGNTAWACVVYNPKQDQLQLLNVIADSEKQANSIVEHFVPGVVWHYKCETHASLSRRFKDMDEFAKHVKKVHHLTGEIEIVDEPLGMNFSGNEAIVDASEIEVIATEAAPADLQLSSETVNTILPLLKSAFAEEVNAWYQYYIIAPFLAGKERANVVADYAENGNEELKHASMLLERINQLGGDFTDIEALDKLDVIAKAKYIKPTSTDVAVSLQQVVDAEKGAIETYTALEEASRDIDVVTNRLAKQILEDEQKHLQEALDFLADIK